MPTLLSALLCSTRRLIGRLAALLPTSVIFILLIDEQLRLACRLISLYWHRCHSHTPVGLCCYESSMRPYKVFLAASLPTLIAASCRLYSRHYCRLNSSSHRMTWGITANLSDLHSCIRCHFQTPVGLCCYESSMRPYKVFLTASLPTLIAASLPTRFVVW
jgi:hypothetical protein